LAGEDHGGVCERANGRNLAGVRRESACRLNRHADSIFGHIDAPENSFGVELDGLGYVDGCASLVAWLRST
jgi:hypothetical protein